MRKSSVNLRGSFLDFTSGNGKTGETPHTVGKPTLDPKRGRVVRGGTVVPFQAREPKALPRRVSTPAPLLLLFLLLPPGYAQAPAPPTGLTVTGASDAGISLSWAAPAGEVDAYNVFRCVERAQACTPEWYVWLQGGATTTYTDDGSADPDGDGTPAGLSAGATYRYAVLAIHYERITTGPWPEHQSAWSNQVTAVASPRSQSPTDP